MVRAGIAWPGSRLPYRQLVQEEEQYFMQQAVSSLSLSLWSEYSAAVQLCRFPV
jgi:hypothetical protein